MKKKHEELLKILIESNGVIKSEDLSLLLNVSTKTIRNYVSEINSESYCINSSTRGYSVDQEVVKKLLGSNGSNNIPETQDERISYILMRLLKRRDDTKIDLYDLAAELLVSIETIKKDFVVVKEKLVEFNIYVKNTGDYVVAEGLERDKRKLLSSLISSEFNNNVMNLETLSLIFPYYDVRNLIQLVTNKCNEYRYFINDYALANLILEILIGIDRIKNNFASQTKYKFYEKFGYREVELANRIVSEIEDLFSIKYSDIELREFTNILISSLLKLDFENINYQNLEEIIGTDCKELVDQIKIEMGEWGFLDLRNEDFLIKFSLHIRNLVFRLDTDNQLKNPLTHHIKMTCPLIFEHAVAISNTIKNFTGKSVNEDEIVFLALHIGNIMGEIDYLKTRVGCVLLLPQYYNFSSKMIEQITEIFKNEIVVSQVISADDELDNIDYGNIELIISTIDLSARGKNFKSVQITPFFTANDRASISKSIEQIKLKHRSDYLTESLINITDPVLFCKNVRFKNKEQAIEYMCDKMLGIGCVNSEYYKEILEREEQSSTAFGKLAVPHSIEMNAKTTKMFIMINDKAIDWDDNKVNLVLLFAIKREERSVFFNVFDNLVSELLEPSKLNSVLKSANIDEFIINFVNCLDNN